MKKIETGDHGSARLRSGFLRLGPVIVGICLVTVLLSNQPAAASNWALNVGFGNGGVAATPSLAESVSVAVDRQGRIYSTVGQAQFGAMKAARFLPDGQPDRSFGRSGRVEVVGSRKDVNQRGRFASAQDLVARRDGSLVIVGNRTHGGFQTPYSSMAVASVLANGCRDRSFARAGYFGPRRKSGDLIYNDSEATSVALRGRGRIAVGGTRYTKDSTRPQAVIWGLTRRGKLDRRFGKRGVARFNSKSGRKFAGITSVTRAPGNKLLAVGYRNGRGFLTRMTASGKIDRSFGGGDGVVGFVMRIQPSCVTCQGTLQLATGGKGRIAVVGVEQLRTGTRALTKVLAFNSSGRPAKSFGQDGVVELAVESVEGRQVLAFDVLVLNGNRILVVGRDYDPGLFAPDVDSPVAILQLKSDGNLNEAFSPRGLWPPLTKMSLAQSVALGPDSSVVIGGKRGFGQDAKLSLAKFLAKP